MDAAEIMKKIEEDKEFRMKFVKAPLATLKEVYPLTPTQEAELKKINFDKLINPESITDCGNKHCQYMAG